jgi:hypothetical protein
MKIILHSLDSLDAIETFGEPEVTTTSGRQTQMRATQVISVITNMATGEIITNKGIVGSFSIKPQTTLVEIGPVLDVVPYVLSDGYTIKLNIIPWEAGFNAQNNPQYGHVTTVNLVDNQTVVCSGLEKNFVVNANVATGKSTSSDKEMLVFITATIVDAAGNRVHSDVEMP